MTPGSFRFEDYVLDPANRQLRRGGASVELNGRYFDALVLLVRERGTLVSKDRFLAEVWRGVPVTDEALSQCVKTLRRQLGDSAASPRFIETVPKHGYRFIAPVEDGEAATTASTPPDFPWREFFVLGGAGTAGGGMAGVVGGLFYGFIAASQPGGMGAVSVLLVLACLTTALALVGGAGVSFGIAAAVVKRERAWHWNVLGGAGGGLLVGAVVKLLGIDAFNLLFGQSPGDVTGAAEGALLGAGVGAAAWLAQAASLRRGVAIAACSGAAAGLLISVLGGRLMGGSLDLLARQFPTSRLRLDQIGTLFGEHGFGPVSRSVTNALEAALFVACVVSAMIIARQRRSDRQSARIFAPRAASRLSEPGPANTR